MVVNYLDDGQGITRNVAGVPNWTSRFGWLTGSGDSVETGEQMELTLDAREAVDIRLRSK